MDTFKLAKRLNLIKPSPTLAVTMRAAALKKAGKDVIGLGAGEPDFDTPTHIKKAAIQAIEVGFTKYTEVNGILSLRQAISEKFKRDNQLAFTPQQIIVSSGGKQCFYNLAQAVLNPNDEAIVLCPYWVSYPDIILLAGGRPVFVSGLIEQNFKVKPEDLEKAITPKTRLLVINSPSNPSGFAYSKSELQALAQVLLKHPQVLIASDDMYEYIFWGKQPFSNILNVCPDLTDRTIILHGVSKTYAMTGWRIGFAAGPQKLIAAMTTLQSQSTSNPCSISQVAAEAALNGPQDSVEMMCAAFKERHDYVIEHLNKIPGIHALEGDGTFYAFPKVSDLITRLQGKTTVPIHNDLDLAEYLLTEAGVAVVPGSAFGAEGYLRLSFATKLENLSEALTRMQAVLKT